MSNVLIVGVGNESCRALKKLKRLPKECSILGISADPKSFSWLPSGASHLLLNKKWHLRKNGWKMVKEKLKGTSYVFILSSCGDGITAPKIAVMAKDRKAKYFLVTAYPATSVMNILGLRRDIQSKNLWVASGAFLEGAVEVIGQILKSGVLGKETKTRKVK